MNIKQKPNTRKELSSYKIQHNDVRLLPHRAIINFPFPVDYTRVCAQWKLMEKHFNVVKIPSLVKLNGNDDPVKGKHKKTTRVPWKCITYNDFKVISEAKMALS